MRSEELSYFEEEEFKEALQQYESALHEGRPIYMDADELTDIAEYYMVKEREADANQCIDLAVRLHPEAIDPQVFLARQQLFHEHLDKAKEIARGIDDQQDREVQYLWAEIGIKEGKAKEASEQLQAYYDTIDEDRDHFLYDAAGVFMDYDEWELATQWARQLKEQFPKYKRTDLLLSDIMVSCGKCVEAVPLLDEILNRDPFNLEAWNLMAEAQSGQEHYHEALEAIEYLLAIDEHNLQGQLIRANSLFHLNRMKEAHAQYKAYLKEVPNDISILHFDSVALTNMERYEEALIQLRTAMDLCKDEAPELPHIYLQISYLLSKMGETSTALLALEEAYKLGKHNMDVDYELLKGHILLESKNLIEAELCFEEAVKHSDDVPNTLLTIAIDYAESEYYNRAMEMLLSLLESDMPDKEARCLPYLAYCAHFVPCESHYKDYLHAAALCNPSLTEYLFSPIYPNVPIDQYKNL